MNEHPVVSLNDIAAEVRQEHNAVRLAARQAIEHAFRAGNLLLQAKALVEHGFWGDWLHAHCDLSERTAQNYMRLARNQLAIAANPQLPADLPIEDALYSIARPKPSFLGTDDDHAIVPGAAKYLPAEGRALLSKSDIGWFVIRESKKYPGYFDLACWEFLPGGLEGLDDNSFAGFTTNTPKNKPILHRGIETFFDHCITLHRHFDIDALEWEDCDAARARILFVDKYWDPPRDW